MRPTAILMMIWESIVCIHLYAHFWITITDLDLLYNLNCYSFWSFLVFTFYISATSYYTGQFFLLANQRLPYLLLVDIGYSGALFLF